MGIFSGKQEQSKILNKTSEETKSFTYTKGDVKLTLSVRVDVLQKMKDLLECLDAATRDIKSEIEIRRGKIDAHINNG